MKTIDPMNLKVNDVIAAAERRGLVLDGDTLFGWIGRSDDGKLHCCPVAALAIDADPTLAVRASSENTYEIQRVNHFPSAFIRGLTNGFDGSDASVPKEFGRLYLRGFVLGKGVLRRIRPDLFPENEEED